MRLGDGESITRLQTMATEAMVCGDQQAATFFMGGLANAARTNAERADVYRDRAYSAEEAGERLQERVRVTRWVNGLLLEVQQEDSTMAIELRRERDALRQDANSDALTGLPNLRALNEALPVAEADPDMDVLLIDINNFGVINKLREFGMAEGDNQLQEIAACFALAAEEFNVSERRLFRKGGDEMVALVPHAKVDFYPRDPAYVVVEEKTVGADGSKKHYRPVPETTEERNDRIARTEPLTITVAEAIALRAAELYGYVTYVGNYGDEGVYSAIVSLAGAAAGNFAEADERVQPVKSRVKAMLLDLHHDVAARHYAKGAMPAIEAAK